MTEPYFTPFSNGTEYLEWLDHNCCECGKSVQRLGREDWQLSDITCEIERAVHDGMMDQSVFTEEMDKRMNYSAQNNAEDGFQLHWKCGEFEESQGTATGTCRNCGTVTFQGAEVCSVECGERSDWQC